MSLFEDPGSERAAHQALDAMKSAKGLTIQSKAELHEAVIEGTKSLCKARDLMDSSFQILEKAFRTQQHYSRILALGIDLGYREDSILGRLVAETAKAIAARGAAEAVALWTEERFQEAARQRASTAAEETKA